MTYQLANYETILIFVYVNELVTTGGIWMDLMIIMALGLPAIIFTFVLFSLYKMFVKKKSLTPFYTPFDEITGQSQVEFHVEQEILAEDEDQGDDKNKNRTTPKVNKKSTEM